MKLPPRVLGLVVVGMVVPAVAGCGKQHFAKAETTEMVQAQPVEAQGDEPSQEAIAADGDGGAPKPRPDPCPACGMG